MAHLSNYFEKSFSSIPGVDLGELRKARRVEQVRNMWAGLVSQVFLDHTNNVFVFKKDDRTEMHVYVDESIYAAELNNRRELIKLECREKYGEAIDDFYIHISRGKYKENHPFKNWQSENSGIKPIVPLSEKELADVETACEKIPDERLRASFKKAMISDLEWKKSDKL